MRVLICRLLVMVAPLGGCAAMSGQSQNIFVSPGKYHFLRCQDIAPRVVATAKRQQELSSLIDRANQSSVGPVISKMVYGPEMQQVREDAHELQVAATEKNCDATLPPAKDEPAKDEPTKHATGAKAAR